MLKVVSVLQDHNLPAWMLLMLLVCGRVVLCSLCVVTNDNVGHWVVIYPNFWDEKHHKTQSSLNFPFTERIALMVIITKPQQIPGIMFGNCDEMMTISFSFLEPYLNSSVIWRPALGEEAEGGVQPHHVVPLEAVLECSH